MVMAINEWCVECDRETMHHNSKCVKCIEAKRRLNRAVWIALTNEEKIERLLKRIEQLERSPMKY
jgi:predicted amidophosphoribosyltransferase